MFKKWLNFQVTHAWFFLIASLLVITTFAFYGTQIQIDAGLEVLVPSDSEYNINQRILVNAFGQRDAMVAMVALDRESIVTSRPATLRDDSLDSYFDELSTVLAQSQFVDTIAGPQFSYNDRYARFIVSMHVPDTPEGYRIVRQELQRLMSEVGTPPGVTAELAGFALLLDRIPTLLITDALTTMIITMVMVMIILYYYFRSFRLSAITASTPLFGLLILGGVMVLLKIDITVTLAAIGVFIIGLGVDYGIHISIHYQEHRKAGHAPPLAVKKTMRELALPITASFMTTLAGFSALILGFSPSSQSQGFVLAFGIIAIYLISMILVPVLLELFAAKVRIRENELFSVLTKKLVGLALFQSKRPKLVIITILVITGVMFYGLTQVKFSTSNSNWIPDDEPISVSFRENVWAYGDDDDIFIVLKAKDDDLRHVFTAKDVQRLTALLRNVPHVDRVTSAYDDIPLSQHDVHDVLTHEQSDRFDESFQITLIHIESEFLGADSSGLSPILEQIRQIIATFPVHNAEVSLFGNVVRFEELNNSLQQDAQQTTLMGFALVFLVASMVYGSFTVGLSALFPIILAIIWAIGLMGFFNVPFTSLSTGIVSLVLGIGSDFSIHLVDGMRRNAAQGNSLEKSLNNTLKHTGSPILLSSLTTLFGFLALTGATLLGTQRLGLSLAFAIISVFVVTVSMVPAIMALSMRKKFKQKKRGIPT